MRNGHLLFFCSFWFIVIREGELQFPLEAKKCYKEKIDIIGFDPYTLNTKDFGGGNPGATKSLEAYNLFMSGWEQELQRNKCG